MIHASANALRLAWARVVILGTWLVELAADPFPALAGLPPAWFAPHGPWALLPAAVREALWNVPALTALELATMACVGLALMGAPHPRVWAGLAAALLTVVASFVRGFGHVDHSTLQLLFVTYALPFLPAWDALRVRVSAAARPAAPSTYAAAFAALALVFAFPYFLTAAYRLAHEGYAIFTGLSMLHFVTRDTLMLDDLDFRLGLALAEHPAWQPVLNLGFAAVTLAELAAPWVHLRRSACAAWLLIILPFHLFAPLLMHVLFAHNLALIAVLYVWPLTWRRTAQLVAREK